MAIIDVKKLTNLNNYKSAATASNSSSGSVAPTTAPTADSIATAFNKLVQFELSEAGNEHTLFNSNDYDEGFTHGGKVVNGSCTLKGMQKLILGDYVTVYKDKNGDGKTSEDEAMNGAEAMADSYDSVLDLLTQEKFRQVLQEYGNGTFSNNCNFMKHADEIREKYGIDIKEVPTQGPDGISHRTYEISLVDTDGSIIEDEEGNKSTILFGDWVIPDGCAQGAEFDFIAVLDEVGYDCVSKADFINNPELGGAEGYDQLLSELEADFNKARNGQAGEYMKSGESTINDRTYLDSKFEWWSRGGSFNNYGTQGVDSSLLGGAVDMGTAIDYDGDGIITPEEEAKALEEAQTLEKETVEKEEKEQEKETLKKAYDKTTGSNYEKNAGTAQLSYGDIDDMQTMYKEMQEENPELSEKEIIKEISKELNIDADLVKDNI